MNIWILDSDSGVTLVYSAMESDLPINEDLVSGLLTALNQFTMVEFHQPIESIEMGGLRWVYVIEKEVGLMFIAASTKDVKAEILKARLIVIEQSFVQSYIHDREHWKEKWNGNIEMFKGFKSTISEYYGHWKQAENITTLAEFFDILGIFQQLLNQLINIVDQRVSGTQNKKIYVKLEKLFADLLKSPSFVNDPGLSQITFEREVGFSIISVLPSESNMLVAESEIIKIITAVVEVIRSEAGYLSCLNHFAEESIFEYLLDNIKLLQELHLEQFLLKLFLLK